MKIDPGIVGRLSCAGRAAIEAARGGRSTPTSSHACPLSGDGAAIANAAVAARTSGRRIAHREEETCWQPCGFSAGHSQHKAFSQRPSAPCVLLTAERSKARQRDPRLRLVLPLLVL